MGPDCIDEAGDSVSRAGADGVRVGSGLVGSVALDIIGVDASVFGVAVGFEAQAAVSVVRHRIKQEKAKNLIPVDLANIPPPVVC